MLHPQIHRPHPFGPAALTIVVAVMTTVAPRPAAEPGVLTLDARVAMRDFHSTRGASNNLPDTQQLAGSTLRLHFEFDTDVPDSLVGFPDHYFELINRPGGEPDTGATFPGPEKAVTLRNATNNPAATIPDSFDVLVVTLDLARLGVVTDVLPSLNIDFDLQNDAFPVNGSTDESVFTTVNGVLPMTADQRGSQQFPVRVPGDSATTKYRFIGTSAVVTLGPKVVVSPDDRQAAPGSTVVLSTFILGDGGATYQWTKNGQAIQDNAKVSGATTPELTIMDVEPSDTGSYQLQVIGVNAMVESEAAVVAVPVPSEMCPADQNFDGILNGADFNAWLQNFAAGCP